MRRAVFIVPVFLGLLAGCSGEDDSGTAAAASTACTADTRKDIYTQDMSKPAGDLQVHIVDSEYTPSEKPAVAGQVQKGMNAITVEVLDASGAVVDDAKVSLTLWMQDHGHGSAHVPKIAPMGGGKYALTEVWLPMAGLWTFTIGVTRTGAQTQSADFKFCIDG